jgi:hypothetical protein
MNFANANQVHRKSGVGPGAKRQPSPESTGRLAGRGARAAELSSAEDEKDLLVRPLGRAKGGSPGLALGFRNAMFPSCWRLSPLFTKMLKFLFFPPP